MKIAGVEAVRDPPIGVVQHDCLTSHGPIAGEGPVVELQLVRGNVDVPLIHSCATGRREVLGALVAEIIFRRLQAVPVGGGFDASALD